MAPLGVSQALNDRQIGIALTETAFIFVHSSERTAAGGTEHIYTKRDIPVACALSPAQKAGGEYTGVGGRAQKVTPGGRIDERRNDVITLPAGAEIGQHDRIEVSGRGVFEVILVPERSTEIALQIEAREVDD